MTKNKAMPQADLEFIASRLLTAGFDFKGESILVTGGTGFFGKWIVEALVWLNDQAALGNKLTVLSRDAMRALAAQPWLAKRPDVNFVGSDIRNFRTETQFTSIIHGATSASHALNVGHPAEMRGVIVDGANQMIKLAEVCGIKRMQFLSSGAVYGIQPPGLSHVDEAYSVPLKELQGQSAYAYAKLEAENLLADAAKKIGFDFSIARGFAFIGPGLPLDSHFAAGNFIKAVIEDLPIKISGDGTPFRSYMYAADLVVWLMTLFSRVRGVKIHNVGSEHYLSIADLAQIVDEIGVEIKPSRLKLKERVFTSLRPSLHSAPSRYVPSTQKAFEEFGLTCWTDLKTSIRKTLSWHLLNA